MQPARLVKVTLLLSLVALLAAGCSRSPVVARTPVPDPGVVVPSDPDREPIPEEGLELTREWRDAEGATIEFTERGEVRGNDGCNAFAGTWEVESYEVLELSVAAGSKVCDAPPSLRLDEEMTWEREGQSLTLTTEGNLVNELTLAD